MSYTLLKKRQQAPNGATEVKLTPTNQDLKHNLITVLTFPRSEI